MTGSLDTLRTKVRNGDGITGDDAMNTEQVRLLAPGADVVTDITIAQSQVATFAWMIDKQLRDKGIVDDAFGAISGPMRQAITNLAGPTLIEDDNTHEMVQARTVDEWNVALDLAWGAIDTAQEATDNATP